MNNEEEKRCPLCAEEMDWTDQQLNPCKCGYEVCVWCWHHVMDMAEKDATEGRCPACRTPYDKDRIVESNFQRVAANSSNRKQKLAKPKPKQIEVRKDLSNVRVIQRKMAYIIGLPLDLADEDLLQRKNYFGQYGKVTKISLSRTSGGALQQFVNDTCSVYITYSKEEEAVTCIQAVHGYVLDGMLLRASFGTAKYCHAWLRNMPCNNPGCLYLHTVGAEEDSFGKDEVAAVHTRNRVQEIVGGTHYPPRRSGSTLPPPVIDQSYKHTEFNIEPKVVSPHPEPEPEPEPIKSSPKNTTTFVDIVGRGSSNSSSVKEEEDEEDDEEEEEEEDDKLDSVNGGLNDGYNEMIFENLAKSDRIYRGSNSFSNEEIVEHLRRLDVNNDGNSADVESSIISDILSIDLDGCDNSVAGLFEARDGRQHSDQSRFSFANPQNDIGYRAQSITPPGFSMMPSKPPPGFSCMRTDHAVSSGSYFRSMPNSTHYRTPSFGNLSNSSDDVAVGGGKSWANGLTNSWPSSYSSTSTSFDDDSKHWNFIPPPQQPPSQDDLYGGLTSLHHPSLYTQQPKRNEVEKLGGGYESFLPNYGEYMFQMPNSSTTDVYTRVFGM